MRSRLASAAAALVIAPLLFMPARSAAQTPPQPLTLQQAVALALRNSPEYLSAQLSARIASDDVRTAQAVLAPSLTVADQYQTQAPVAELSTPFGALPFTPNTTNVPLATARYTIFNAAASARISQNEANLAAADANEREARSALIARVSRSYFALQAAMDSEGVAQFAEGIAGQHVHDARLRFAAGVVPRAEVLQAQTDLAQRIVEEIDARNAVALAQSSLDAAMNVPLSDSYVPVSRTQPAVSQPALDSLIASAKSSRGDLAAAQAAISAAQYTLRAARSEALPHLDVSVSEGNVQPPVTPGFHAQFTAALSAVWTAFDGGARTARTDSAQAALEQAQLALQQMQTSTELAVREAYLNVVSARESLRAAQRAVDYADENRRLAEVRYRGGVGTSLEVRDAELRDLTARLQIVSAQTALARSTVDLQFAAGLL